MGGAIVSAFIVTPLDVVKTRLQASPTRGVGTYRMMANIVSREGMRALWNGLGLTIVNAVPTVGVYLFTYDLAKEHLLTTSNVNTASIPVLAGVLARTIAVVLSAPIENARTMAQASDGSWRQLQDAVRSRGVRTLWRGFWPYLARDVPFSALYWGLLEHTRTIGVGMLVGHQVHPREAVAVSEQLTAIQLMALNFGCGLTSAVVAATVTTPVDVVYVKTVTSKHEKSPLQVTQSLYQQGGASSFFRGLTPRIMKIAPSCAVVIMAYEILKRVSANHSPVAAVDTLVDAVGKPSGINNPAGTRGVVGVGKAQIS